MEQEIPGWLRDMSDPRFLLRSLEESLEPVAPPTKVKLPFKVKVPKNVDAREG